MRNTPAVDVMYDDMIREKGVLWLYGSVLKVIPKLVPALISLWFKTRNHTPKVPFLNFQPLLDRSLFEIRQEFNLLSLLK